MLAGLLFDIMGNYQLAFRIAFAFSGMGLILSSLLRPIGTIGTKGGAND